MTRQATKGLLTASGLAAILLFLAIGAPAPVHAAPPLQPAVSPGALQEPQGTAPARAPAATALPAATPAPTSTMPAITATPMDASPLVTPPLPTRGPSPIRTPTRPFAQSPGATATPTESPTWTPTPTHTPTSTPTPPVPPLPTSTPTATPTPSLIAIAITHLPRNPLLVAALCMIPLFVLGALLILGILWRKRPQPPPPPPPPIPTGPYLESVGPPSSTRRLYLKPDGVTIGQAPENDVVITQDLAGWETVSRYHARIQAQGGRWIVEDLGSTNGVYVNGIRTGRNLLRDGWRLGLGGVEFVFHTNTGEDRQ